MTEWPCWFFQAGLLCPPAGVELMHFFRLHVPYGFLTALWEGKLAHEENTWCFALIFIKAREDFVCLLAFRQLCKMIPVCGTESLACFVHEQR